MSAPDFAAILADAVAHAFRAEAGRLADGQRRLGEAFAEGFRRVGASISGADRCPSVAQLAPAVGPRTRCRLTAGHSGPHHVVFANFRTADGHVLRGGPGQWTDGDLTVTMQGAGAEVGEVIPTPWVSTTKWAVAAGHAFLSDGSGAGQGGGSAGGRHGRVQYGYQASGELGRTAGYCAMDAETHALITAATVWEGSAVLAAKVPAACQTCDGSGIAPFDMANDGHHLTICPDCPTIGTLLAYGFNVATWAPTRRHERIADIPSPAQAVADAIAALRTIPEVTP